MKESVFLLFIVSLSSAHAWIVGGKDLDYASTHAASIVYISTPDNQGQTRTCTGTLISSEFVLTAGHCIASDKNSMSMHFKMKDYRKNQDLRDLEIIDTHRFEADLGLIRFRGGLPVGARISNLPSKKMAHNQIFDFMAIGYGADSGIAQTGIGELRFKKMASFLVSTQSSQFMVDQHKNNGGVCHGDSGGPALVKNTIIGIAVRIRNERKMEDKCKDEAIYLNLFYYAAQIRAKISDLIQSDIE